MADPVDAAKAAHCDALNAYTRQVISGGNTDQEWTAIFIALDALIAAVRAENDAEVQDLIERAERYMADLRNGAS